MSSPHTVKAFDEDLKALARNVTAMGEFAGAQFSTAVRALLHGDWTLAQQVIDHDRRLDALRTELSTAAATVIARRQPLATDLTEVLATFRIAEDLERIGDLAKNIAKRATAVASSHFPEDIVERLDRLASLASEHLKSALDAFIARDAEQALIVRQQDEKIDTLYTQVFQELVGRLSIDPTQTMGFVHLLFCAKNIERIGDHATHIAEAAYLIATGHRPESERQRLDRSSTLGGDPA
ncbi:MAG: phosphate signaling complex protein PhoU [Steroidobacteraceae bacterium]